MIESVSEGQKYHLPGWGGVTATEIRESHDEVKIEWEEEQDLVEVDEYSWEGLTWFKHQAEEI